MSPVSAEVASHKEPKELDSNRKTQKPGDPYRFAHLLPDWSEATRLEHFPPLTPFVHQDPAARALGAADPTSYLLPASRFRNITPRLGFQVEGVDLTKLTGAEKDQLALHVAKQGLGVFRGQENFLNQDIEQLRDWGQYFGRLHIHPTSAHPVNAPELHLVYKNQKTTFNFELDDHISSTLWHSDVSYELQPPGLTTLFLLSSPSTGGDTLFISQVEAFKKLSPPFQAFLRSLKAVHSGVEQANHSRAGNRGGVVRREPVEHTHPVVRRHPVTGEEALYVNKQFTTRIVGLKHEESQNVLNFIFDHIAKAGDCQARVVWEPNTVVLWDNRVTAHTAIVDFNQTGETRHGVRITPQAERPVPAGEGLTLD